MGCKRILIERRGSILLHEVRASCFGTREKMLETAAWLQDANEKQVRIICARTRCSHEVARKWLRFDKNFTAEGALNVDLADEIFDLPDKVIRFAGGGAVPSQIIPRTCDESKAQLLLQCLSAVGEIETADREKLIRDIRFWALSNVKQFAAASSSQQPAEPVTACSESAPTRGEMGQQFSEVAYPG
jgi:hypothetical protein